MLYKQQMSITEASLPEWTKEWLISKTKSALQQDSTKTHIVICVLLLDIIIST